MNAINSLTKTKLTTADISVVIPLYNKAEEIERTLLSITAQSVQPKEIIVVDDGSLDDGAARVEALKAREPQLTRLIFIKQKNSGVSKARNVGVYAAQSNVVAFLDADDVWEPEFIAEMCELMTKFPKAKAFASGYYKVCDSNMIKTKIRMPKTQDSRILSDFFAICSRGDLPFITSSFCINREFFKRIGGFPFNERMGEDQDVFAKTALFGDIAYSPKKLSKYHLDAGNRACNLSFPEQECGFSQRLNQRVQSGSVDLAIKDSVIKYTATHLIHLIRMNLAANKLAPARTLLQDPRCNTLPLKKLFCLGYLNAVKFKLFITKFKPNAFIDNRKKIV